MFLHREQSVVIIIIIIVIVSEPRAAIIRADQRMLQLCPWLNDMIYTTFSAPRHNI